MQRIFLSAVLPPTLEISTTDAPATTTITGTIKKDNISKTSFLSIMIEVFLLTITEYFVLPLLSIINVLNYALNTT